ncbi:MAG TPA: branched-chain amino acid ABC transporter permease [Proteobacteria bacterium]|nr:branched-chain amino acid ABC transporter permease [Pseudomonadota bacterium]
MHLDDYLFSDKRYFPLLLALVLLLPWLPLGEAGPYVIRVATLTLVYMVLALGLNVVPGFTGLLDLGYVGFFGLGAYTAGLLTVQYQWSLWLVLPLAALHGALWGVLRGAPTLRLADDYFAIVTFGFSELIILVIRNELWLTRGPMGVPGIARPDCFGYLLEQPWQTYYLILFFLLVVLWVVVRIRGSRLGRAWFAIREDETAAECVGINVAIYKIIAFALSAAIGALAGAFYARWFRFIHPDMFKFWESILILCLIVFGGMGSITGALLGALVLIPLTEILRIVLPAEMSQARYLCFGLIIVVMMRRRPAGLLPLEKE